jgi:Na+(H+)/acetate symporter ActP
MNSADRSALTWVVLGLLATLVTTNVIFTILQHTGGPLIGAAFYAVLLTLAWRGQQRNHRAMIVGGLVGLAVHVVEVVTMGWSAYPVLMVLNLILPAGLVLVAWAADRGTQQEKRKK